MLGELLLPNWQYTQLTWDQLDSILAGQDTRRQRELVGFRLVAAQVHNMLADKALKPHEYLYLPAIDELSGSVRKPNSDWLQRMKEKHGDKLEV